MFDNTKPNIILLTEHTEGSSMIKSIGPYRVASELRNAGFQVAVLNHLSGFSIEELKHILTNIISDQTLFVGINNFFYADLSKISAENNIFWAPPDLGSFLPHGKKFNKEIKKLIKSTNSKCKIVLGGPNATDQSYVSDFDFVVVGYAENSIVNLAKYLFSPSTPLEKSYKSIYGPVIVNDSKAEGFNFTDSNTIYNDDDIILPGETLVLEIARGCIFSCAFCSYPLNGKKKLDYIRSKDRIRDELIRNYKKFGVNRYIFSDDTFNDSTEKCQMIYEISKSLPFKLEWWAYLRLDLFKAHPQTIEWLIESGLRAAFFGIETLNPSTATAIGKGGNREQLFSVAHQIKEKYGDFISLHGSFIFGLPYEDIDSMKKTGDFLLGNQNPLDSWSIQPLNIRPASKTYSNDFLSDIDRNYSKYGYKDCGESFFQTESEYAFTRHPNGFMMWENQYTDWYAVRELAKLINLEKISKTKAKVLGIRAFGHAGLGLPLEEFLNKPLSNVNWRQVNLAKHYRTEQYKKELFKKFNIPTLDTSNAKLFHETRS